MKYVRGAGSKQLDDDMAAGSCLSTLALASQTLNPADTAAGVS